MPFENSSNSTGGNRVSNRQRFWNFFNFAAQQTRFGEWNNRTGQTSQARAPQKGINGDTLGKGQLSGEELSSGDGHLF